MTAVGRKRPERRRILPAKAAHQHSGVNCRLAVVEIYVLLPRQLERSKEMRRQSLSFGFLADPLKHQSPQFSYGPLFPAFGIASASARQRPKSALHGQFESKPVARG